MKTKRTSNPRRFKDAVYEHVARIGKAISSPKRLEILDLLCQGEKSVDGIAKHGDLDVKNASAHLKVLHSARLVDSRRDGKRVYYRIGESMVADYWLMTRAVAEHRFAEIERAVKSYFNERETMVTLDRQALLGKARKGDVIVLDVRPRSEYEQAHLPHARSVPLTELKQRLATLPRNKQIIAYCRGPYCVLSLEALEILRKRGFKAFRLSDGVLEWQAAGFPLVRNASPEL
jgi:rhodanese-related sulfurtransferase